MHFRKLVTSQQPVVFIGEVDVSALAHERKDIVRVSPLAVHLTAQLAENDSVDIQGHLSATVDMLCARCLVEIRECIHVSCQERFKQGKAYKHTENDEIVYVEEESIDLTLYAEQIFILNVPFVCVCSDTCRGLCPTCGCNQNETNCKCNDGVIDPRLAVLHDFFK